MEPLSRYHQLGGHAILDDNTMSNTIIANPRQNMYSYVEIIDLSVYEAAEGGGGILEIADTNGNVFRRYNTDGVKDIYVNYGKKGIKLSDDKDVGVQVLLSGALTQASVSIAIRIHLDNK